MTNIRSGCNQQLDFIRANPTTFGEIKKAVGRRIGLAYVGGDRAGYYGSANARNNNRRLARKESKLEMKKLRLTVKLARRDLIRREHNATCEKPAIQSGSWHVLRS